MRELTQTVTASAANGWAGNCWQTCIACLLDIDPEEMPPQAEYDLYTTNDDGTRGPSVKEGPGARSYHGALRAYLREHHDLAYCEVHLFDEAYAALLVNPAYRDGYHMMTGRTVRSDSMGGLRHVVVGRNGSMVWDPHPSRVGLLEEIRWAFLVPYPKWWRESDARPGSKVDPCVCPKCSAQFAVAS